MEDPIVELQSGFVRGLVEKHEDGFDYYAFKGIPFAEPPIGKLRFKDPVPKKKWTGVLDCTKYGQMCLQYDFFAKVTSYNEDCLHLNVYTRTINKTNVNDPVLVVVHGGAYMFGANSNKFLGPDYLIRKNVVIVTIGYRLGVLGFLDLEDEIAPGNQGLKDQVIALKWVQQNIQAFGGDPGNVTAFGISGGGSASHYLAMSPLTKGLIHKMISQSCVAYNPWTTIPNPKANAVKLCSLLGKELVESEEIVEFLQSVDAKMLQEAQERLRLSLEHLPFGPGFDSKSPNPFLPMRRDIAGSKGIHIPCLVGYNAQGGLLILIGKGSREEAFKMYDQNFKLALAYNGEEVLRRHGLSETQFRRLYYKSEPMTHKNLEKFVNLKTDLLFIEGVHKFAREQAEKSSAPTYFYVFEYDSPKALSKTIIKDAPTGAAFLDDIPYVFKVNYLEELGVERLKKGTQGYRIMEQMTEMWSNFARYGRPTIDITELTPVQWQPIADGTVLRHLSIDEDITMKLCVNVDLKYLSAKSIKV